MQEAKEKEVVKEQATPEKKASEEKKFEKKKDKIRKENEKVLKLEEENKNLQDKVLRITAEMQNIRRRDAEEKARLLKYEGEDFIKQLLPVVDNFERAINMDDANLEDEVSKFLSGFKMIYGNLNNILSNYEIKVIDALNKPFDPNTMEAVMTEEIKDVEPNIVIDVLQKGYTYKDKVIRTAMVKVSK